MLPERFDSLAIETGQLPRRAILRSTAAGFGLALAGLFTSPVRDEAAAGGKGKKRRARKRKKNKQDNGAPGGFDAHNVRLIAENLTADSLYFKGFIVNDDHQCPTKDLRTIPSNTAPTFAPGTWNAHGLILDQDGLQYTFGGYDQDPEDGFPAVEMAHGGTLTKERCVVDGTSDVARYELGVGMSFEKTIAKFRFVVKREEDIENDRVFRFQIYTAP